MLSIPGRWVWDSWTVDDGDDHHLFYLQAPNEGHPRDRHRKATIGHAVSTDYVKWTVLPDVLPPATRPAWDDLALWTGSVVRGNDGTWHLFYSALSEAEDGRIQRIGRADSQDLLTWIRHGSGPLVEADERWYETLETASWPGESWRDPFVLRDPAGDGWHMLITARGKQGDRFDRGVIGHAWSADLGTWEVRPPLSQPSGFGQLEVPATVHVDGRWLLLFCCLAPDLHVRRRQRTPRTGMWSAPAESPLGPFDLDRAAPFEDPSIYAAHLVRLDGKRVGLLGFRDGHDDSFRGEIPAPVPVRINATGTLSRLVER